MQIYKGKWSNKANVFKEPEEDSCCSLFKKTPLNLKREAPANVSMVCWISPLPPPYSLDKGEHISRSKTPACNASAIRIVSGYSANSVHICKQPLSVLGWAILEMATQGKASPIAKTAPSCMKNIWSEVRSLLISSGNQESTSNACLIKN